MPGVGDGRRLQDAASGTTAEEGVSVGPSPLARRIVRRVREGPYKRQLSIGMRRDLTVPFTPVAAKVPLVLRDFDPDDMQHLFIGEQETVERERRDLVWRLERAAYKGFDTRCLVAADERTGRACHVQWLTQPGYSDDIRRAGGLPTLGIGEALLENAFTAVHLRNLGIMTAAISMIAQRAAAMGTRVLHIYIDIENLPSRAAARRAGMIPHLLRTWTQYGFGAIRIVRFEKLSAESGSTLEEPSTNCLPML